MYDFRDASPCSISVPPVHHMAVNLEVVFMSHRPIFKGWQVLVSVWLTAYSRTRRSRSRGFREAIYFIGFFLRHCPQAVMGHFFGTKPSIPMARLLTLFLSKTLECYHNLSIVWKDSALTDPGTFSGACILRDRRITNSLILCCLTPQVARRSFDKSKLGCHNGMDLLFGID